VARLIDQDTFVVQDHDRGLPKTTYADAPVETFTDLGSLILSLPGDSYMTGIIQKNWDFDRVQEERRNVRVTAYLFAIHKESDNDFHLIIDDDGQIADGAKLNVEIAGIPDQGPDQDAIRTVRQAFKDHFGGNPPREYKPFLDPPQKITIEGSLFFDVDHAAGAVGPTGYRPSTAWEIHPVRKIEFSDN
jgi:hypothetical protein